MSELSKTHIDIIDESAYGAGSGVTIPLYVFATEQDKIVDEETSEVAIGTTKALANELLVVTSRKNVAETFGTPKFTEINGTIQQGDELNEVGLYGLYDAMGNASVGYALRADIDLKQLKHSSSEPVAKVADKTLWFDALNTSFGLFRANGNVRPSMAWDSIETVLFPTDGDLDSNKKPLSTLGNGGDIAVVLDGVEQKFYENINQTWFLIGSQEWVEQYPSQAMGKKGGSCLASSKISVQGIEVLLTGTTVDEAVKAINSKMTSNNIKDVVAINSNETLVIKKSDSKLELKELDNNKAFETFGFKVVDKMVIVDKATLTCSKHSQTPSGTFAGSIWFKTTEPNNGAKYILKEYDKTNDFWADSTIPVYCSFLTAESELTVSNKTVIAKCDSSEMSTKLMRVRNQEYNVFESTVDNPTLTVGESFVISTISKAGEIVSAVITCTTTSMKDVKDFIVTSKLPNIVVELTENNHLRLISTTGKTIRLENHIGTPLEKMGLANAEYSNWEEANVLCQLFEPASAPTEGTLWFNEDFNVDIMVNNGQAWVGYQNYYANATIHLGNSEPESANDYDLWVKTSSTDFPMIHRFIDGDWELIDNTDQTTALGVVFADARENAGPSYVGSTHKEFSTEKEDMLKSDYVDPNCINPLNYPEEILLFNTMYSTNNVKKLTNSYKTAVKDLGLTFKVGESVEFATPGSSKNKKTMRWATASGNATDGSGLFGRKAQRKVIVDAMAEAINSNEDIRSKEYDFFFACCPGYPELDNELTTLNADKSDMFMIVTDTPKTLKPQGTAITNWGANRNNATSHGEDGRVVRSTYMTRQYPPMGLTSNIDGSEIAIPTSIVKMKNLLTTPRGLTAAGTQYGQVTNVSSVGYITEENEYSPVSIRENGLGEIIVGQSMNPIMYQRNTGLLLWGENTENNGTSSLSDEHAVLTLLRLKRELDEACLPFFFRPNIESVRNDFNATLTAILSDYVKRNELYDFTLVTDRSVNTNERIERGELWADIAIDITEFIKQIYLPIRIVKTGSLTTVG